MSTPIATNPRFLESEAELERHFRDGWASATPVQYPNRNLDPPDTAWLRFGVQPLPGPQGARRITIGNENPLFRHAAEVVLEIFTPAGDGGGRALELANAGAALFKDSATGSLAGYRFRPPQLRKLGKVDGYWKINVIIPFDRDTIIN